MRAKTLGTGNRNHWNLFSKIRKQNWPLEPFAGTETPTVPFSSDCTEVRRNPPGRPQRNCLNRKPGIARSCPCTNRNRLNRTGATRPFRTFHVHRPQCSLCFTLLFLRSLFDALAATSRVVFFYLLQLCTKVLEQHPLKEAQNMTFKGFLQCLKASKCKIAFNDSLGMYMCP